MREIIFRGKRKDNGEWVYGYYVHLEDIHGTKTDSIYTGYADEYEGDFFPRCYEVIPETVEQYTGITDDNGTKIFDGDVIRVRYQPGEVEVGAVLWSRHGAKWIFGFGDGYDIFSSKQCQVIGSIHD